MAFNLDKLAKMATPRSERAKEQAKFRKDNREWLDMSHEIALTIHYYLRNARMTQKELAEKMGVSPAYIGKILKGNENLTLETICKLQNAINVDFVSVATPYITHAKIELPTRHISFSDHAVSSKKYCERQPTDNTYGSLTIHAA